MDLPALTAPDDLALFDLLGAALTCMLPVDADVTDTFVQALATIGLSVGRGFEWQSLDESVLAGLRRAAPMVERIIDERWSTMSETVNGWRGSLASGRCSYDWSLNAANTKNQVGTELADQVVYVNTRVDADDQPLTGANEYVLHFEPGQTPPVAGMWNMAMYDDGMLFVPNAIDRFSIGSPASRPPLRRRLSLGARGVAKSRQPLKCAERHRCSATGGLGPGVVSLVPPAGRACRETPAYVTSVWLTGGRRLSGRQRAHCGASARPRAGRLTRTGPQSLRWDCRRISPACRVEGSRPTSGRDRLS